MYRRDAVRSPPIREGHPRNHRAHTVTTRNVDPTLVEQRAQDVVERTKDCDTLIEAVLHASLYTLLNVSEQMKLHDMAANLTYLIDPESIARTEGLILGLVLSAKNYKLAGFMLEGLSDTKSGTVAEVSELVLSRVYELLEEQS